MGSTIKNSIALAAMGLSVLCFSTQSAFCGCEEDLGGSPNSGKALFTKLHDKFSGTWQREGAIEGEQGNAMYGLNTLAPTLTIEARGHDLGNGDFDIALDFKDSYYYHFDRINQGYRADQGPNGPKLDYGHIVFQPRRAYAEMESESYDGKALKKIRFMAYGLHFPLGRLVPARFWQYISPYQREEVTITPSEDGQKLTFEIRISGSSNNASLRNPLIGRVTYRRLR